MTPIFRFEGIYTPVVTPFHADGSVNRDAMADVIENLIDKGVHGLISGGSTGENYAQTVLRNVWNWRVSPMRSRAGACR